MNGSWVVGTGQKSDFFSNLLEHDRHNHAARH
jgi:hypothetical protein